MKLICRFFLEDRSMARVADLVPSWEHRSVYWRTTVNRQFIEDGNLFISFKNRGITEIFRLDRSCVMINRLEKGNSHESHSEFHSHLKEKNFM